MLSIAMRKKMQCDKSKEVTFVCLSRPSRSPFIVQEWHEAQRFMRSEVV